MTSERIKNVWALRDHPRQTKFVDLLRSRDAGQRANKSRDWFRNQAKAVGSVYIDRMSKNLSDRMTTSLTYGRMYLYWYDAKLKKTLPYWDRFPLIFPIDAAEGGFYGINMHYLPYMARAKLMDALYTTLSDKNMDDSTRLKINYGILKSAIKFKYFRPCIKHYLNSHVQSHFLDVPTDQWDIALFLPMERFQKASKDRVWSDSMNQINGK